ncbi:response regulator [Coraliomargarita akajimensis]|uniref:Putative two component, sigma54 specific, transcriptional regulator, Fis family n=1 Tax=Coraliomargarita akajimensis (strain DSM 45221 / IAM 15411 / JCM 23193 / KCTC 12865 / 04OKA010-24) TaxID=583355 RepID=D5EJ35_CORAD|nr:response regulator [Coraliomargarita akajimensis]ADE54434.1 putative two component, sigma54 specific, transcriptional regulator, Fis family [Coraliomargarita akajimensis DSM 45221]
MPSSASILVVDDSAVDREIVSIACSSLECSVEMASGGAEALELYKEKRHTLVLTDYQMAPLNGIDLVLRLKECDPDVECILMTGFPDAQLLNFVQEHELASIITKPIRPGNLRDQLRVALNRDRGATVETSGIALSNRMDDCLPLLGESLEICGVRKRITQLLETSKPLLIQGAVDGGKLEIAQFLHQHGRYGESHYIECHCADMDDASAEAQLLREDGTWGALLQAARNGTLVIANVERLSLPIQQALASQYKAICEAMHVITLADGSLDDLMEEGRLDDLLYFELSLEMLQIPSLMERLMDVDAMVRHIVGNPKRYRLQRELNAIELDALVAMVRRSGVELNTRVVLEQVRDFCQPLSSSQ